jgi:hypothetical protein
MNNLLKAKEVAARSRALTPATWDNVLSVVRASGKSGTTNQQINAALGERAGDDYGARHAYSQREVDVSALTRIMAKAGVIQVAPLVRASIGHIYYL